MREQKTKRLLGVVLIFIVAIVFGSSCSALRNLADQLTGKNNQSDPKQASKIFPVSHYDNIPPDIVAMAPYQMGKSTPVRVIGVQPPPESGLEAKTNLMPNAVRFVYSDVLLDVIKFPSPDDARKTLGKIVSQAVPTAEYDKKVKLPKCDETKEAIDYINTPAEFIKKLPVRSGGDAYVFHSGKFWEYGCKPATARREYVYWTNGSYLLLIRPDAIIDVFGKGESAFNDYQSAMEH